METPAPHRLPAFARVHFLVRHGRQALEVARRDLGRGHPAEAIAVLERSIAAGAEGPALRTMLAIAYVRTHRLYAALDQLERAIELDPSGFGPRCALGELYLRLSILEQGRAHLGRALELASTPEERRCVQGLLRAHRERTRKRARRPPLREPAFVRG